MKTDYGTKNKLQQALDLLTEVEKDCWLLEWNTEQEQDLVESINRLALLISSLQPTHNYDIQVADQLIEAAKQ